MSKKISWTLRMEDGVKREVRVELARHHIKWQFKRADEACWDYDKEPEPADWDELEDILKRRAGRGRIQDQLTIVQKMRSKAGQ